MNFGLILSGGNPLPWQVAAPRHYQSLLNQAVLAEDLGYDSVWTAEHHGTDEYFSAQFPILAAIAARTRRIRIGTYIVILPLYHPLHVAEQAATLDALSDGRFDLGLGQGYVVSEYAAFDVPRKERPKRMEEGLAIIKGVWEQETFEFSGKHFKVAPFSLRPKPVQPRLPIWVAGLTEKSIDRAARYGCHFAGAGAAAGAQMYDAALRRHGHDPKNFSKAALRMVHIAETRERAWAEAAPHMHHQMSVYTKNLDDAGDFKWQGGYFGAHPLPPPEKLSTTPGLHFFGAPFIIGTPDEAITEIERSRAESGTTHLVMWMQIGGMDPRLTEHSMHLFAKEVIPHFRRQ